MSLISLAAYAKHRKVSKAAVTKAIKEGRITTIVDPETGKRKLDPAKADAQWKANTVSGQKSAGDQDPNDAKGGGDPPAGPSYANSRAIREAYSAQMMKLEFQQKKGTLVSAEKVRADAFRTARITRDAILSIPDRISHSLAAETDPHAVNVALTKALVEELRQLAETNANKT